MALHLGDWAYFLITISIVFLVVSFIFCSYATYAGIVYYSRRKSSGDNTQQLSTQKITMILTIVCMWAFTAINFCDAVGMPYFVNQKEAALRLDSNGWADWDGWWSEWETSAPAYASWNVFWAIAKVNLYLVWLYRIYTVSKEIKYESKSIIYYVTLFLLLIQFICMILWLYFYNIQALQKEWDSDTDGLNSYDRCTFVTWSILILDVIISVLLVYLYINCMAKLFQSLPDEALRMDNVNVAGITGGDDSPNAAEQTEMTGGDADNAQQIEEQTWDEKKHELVRTATRLFVVFMVSFISSILYQLLFGIAITEEFYGSHSHTALYYFSFTWNVDSTINVICLFLSLPIGKKLYYSLCKCDGCCFRCIQNMTSRK